MKTPPKFETFTTGQGAWIYRIPLHGFPDFWVYAYLVLVDEMIVLIDTGTNFNTSNQDLENGFVLASEAEGRELRIGDLTHIFITHGHIDHYAGLAYLESKTDALICVHEFDSRILENYEERKVVISSRLREFLVEAGVPDARVEPLMDMYMLTKELFSACRVDLTFEAAGMQVGPFRFLNVPGHSAGAVAIRLHDVVFTGDHVLSDITPHMAPERLTLNSGLSHYLESLAKIKIWAGEAQLALSGHEDPIDDLPARVSAIAAEHQGRLENILEMLDEPKTISEVSRDLFGMVHGYNVLLALEETGAHFEYLYKLGFIGIENLQEVEESKQVIPIRYRRLRDAVDLAKVFPRI